jgi:Na+/proline symporter
MNWTLVSLLGYVVLQLAVVFLLARKPQTESDYLLAGRSLGPWLAVFSVFATWFGAETCIGATAEAYAGGLAAVAADPFGYAIGIVAMGLLFAAALRRRGLLTLADLFRNRWGSGIERLAALVMIPSSLLWAAAQVRAFGQVIASVSDLSFVASTGLAASVVIVYTAVGGMRADAWTDLAQGLVVIAGLVLLLAVFATLGGFETLPEAAAAAAARAPPRERPLIEVLAVPIFGTIAAQELTSRVLAMRDATLARSATVAAGFLYLAVGLIPVLIGLGAAATLGTDIEPEQVLSHYARSQLPAALYVVFLGALLSAILSTLSGALLVAGSLAAHNLIAPLAGPRLTERWKLRLNRAAVVVFGVIAYLIALGSESMYRLVEQASGLASAGVLVLMVVAIFTPALGGVASAAAALIASVVVYALVSALDGSMPYLASVAAAALTYLALAPLGPRAFGAADRAQQGFIEPS